MCLDTLVVQGFDILFYGHEVGFEEDQWMMIVNKANEFYMVEGGYCVYASPEDNAAEPVLQPIDLDQAINEVNEWYDAYDANTVEIDEVVRTERKFVLV